LKLRFGSGCFFFGSSFSVWCVLEAEMKAIELEPFRPTLISAARKVTRDHHLAEDAVQDAFFAVLNKPEAFRGTSAPRTYLHRIVYTKAIDLLRRRATQRLVEVGEDFFSSRADSTFFGRTPEELFLLAEELDSLSTAIKTLSSTQEQVLRLIEMEGASTKEVAKVLGISAGAVRLHLFRAKRKLRRVL